MIFQHFWTTNVLKCIKGVLMLKNNRSPGQCFTSVLTDHSYPSRVYTKSVRIRHKILRDGYTVVESSRVGVFRSQAIPADTWTYSQDYSLSFYFHIDQIYQSRSKCCLTILYQQVGTKPSAIAINIISNGCHLMYNTSVVTCTWILKSMGYLSNLLDAHNSHACS